MRHFCLALALAGVALLLHGCSSPEDHPEYHLQHGSSSDSSDNSTISRAQSFEAHSDANTIPLSAKMWGGGMRLAISVSPVDTDGETLPAQRLVLDTGSSTLAFCNKSIGGMLGSSAGTDFMSCNMYNPGGAPTGYWGRFYQSAVELQSGIQIKQAKFSVMQAEEGMPCIDGFQGIFGIAFAQLDRVFTYLDLGSEIGKQTCPSQPAGDVTEPLLQGIEQVASSKTLGIYWSGSLGDSEAALYLESSATSNAHYVHSSVVGVAALGEIGWYDIQVQELVVSSAGRTWEASDLGCSPTSSKTSCIVDTGTPFLAVPGDVVKLINQLAEQGVPLGSLSVKLAAAGGGEPVALEFDIATLVEKQWIQPGDGNGVILGLPMWAWYYTVFDLTASTATFVSTRQGSPAPTPAPMAPTPTAPTPAPYDSPQQAPPAPLSMEIPLGAKPWGNGTRLTVSVGPVSSSGEALAQQELLLDTGSSTVAFCNSSLSGQVGTELETDYMSCNMYNPGGDPVWYWGRFYQGGLELKGSADRSLDIAKAAYSIMSVEESMPCTQGFDGIFGMAFWQLDQVFHYADLSNAQGNICPDQPVGGVVDPLMQQLRAERGTETLGIYWSGRHGDGEGALYLEGAAKSNPHYEGGVVVGQASLGEVGWFSITIVEVAMDSPSASWIATDLGCGVTSAGSACIMDTGTPVIVVPKQIIAVIIDLVERELPLGSISFALQGPGEQPPVLLQFDIATLIEKQWIVEGGGDGVILGLPLWASYYTVFGIKEQVVTFVSTGLGISQATTQSSEHPFGAARRLVDRTPVVV